MARLGCTVTPSLSEDFDRLVGHNPFPRNGSDSDRHASARIQEARFIKAFGSQKPTDLHRFCMKCKESLDSSQPTHSPASSKPFPATCPELSSQHAQNIEEKSHSATKPRSAKRPSNETLTGPSSKRVARLKVLSVPPKGPDGFRIPEDYASPGGILPRGLSRP